jgi:6-phosphogluconolactonase
MGTQIIIKRNPDEVAAAVAEWLIDSIRGILLEHATCSIALSGGSTPKRLYEMIAENELHCVDWSRVQLFWGDERNVPSDHPDSNYRMVQQAWLDRALATQESRCIPQAFPIKIHPSTPERSAKEYSRIVRHALGVPDTQKSPPCIDIVLLGLGDDAHTASLFPETQALAIDDDLFVANFVPKLGAHRITMTYPLINAARNVAFLVCGSSKQVALDVVWHGPRQGNLYPAQRVQPDPGELLWFLDISALPEHRRPDYQP